jgi:hypothetical protein
MARVYPFRALHYPDPAEALPRLDLDPWNGADPATRALARADERHVLRLSTAPDPSAALRRWRELGWLAEEPDSALYVLESAPSNRLLDRTTPVRFLLGALRPDEDVSELEAGATRSVEPAVAPVPALAPDDHGVLRGLLDDVANAASPDIDAELYGRRFRLWKVSEGRMQKRLRGVLEEVPVRPLGPVPEQGRFLAAVVPLSDPGLQVVPVHRAIREVPTFDPGRFLALVRDYARVYDLDEPLTTGEGLEAARERLGTMARGQHAVLLVLPGGEGKILRFRQALELSQIPAVPRSPTLRSLDLALLNSLVLTTVLGIRDPDAPGHRQVFAIPSVRQLVEQVSEGVFQAGFALNPPPSWELRAVIEAAQRLPPLTLKLAQVPPAGLLFLDPRA